MKTKLIILGLLISCAVFGQVFSLDQSDSVKYITYPQVYDLDKLYFQATVSAGADDTITAGQTYQLAGTMAYMDSVVWTSSETGVFSDNNSITSTYTTSVTGTQTLTLTGYVGNQSTSDNLTLLVNAAYDSDASRYFDAMTTELSDTAKTKINTFIVALKDSLNIDSLAQVFDVMYILANETEEAGLKNVVKRANDATGVNSPTFTAWEGFAGNGTDSYINTNYNPTTHGVNYTQNNASMCIYSRTNSDAVVSDIGYRNGTTLYSGMFISNDKSQSVMRINTAANPTILTVVLNSYGMFITSRNAASQTGLFGYQNKNTLTVDNTGNTVGVPNGNFYIGARNAAGTAESFSNRQYSFAFVGEHITTQMRDDIVDCFEAYMDDNSKGVIAALPEQEYGYYVTDLNILDQNGDKQLTYNDDDSLFLSTNSGESYLFFLNGGDSLGSIKVSRIFEDGTIMIGNDQRIFYSEDNLQTLKESTVLGIDGDAFTASDYDNFNYTGYLAKGTEVDGEEIFVWGNYSTRTGTANTNINIWYTLDGKTVKSAYKFGVTEPILAARHTHFVTQDTLGNFWVGTGDDADRCHILKGVYDSNLDSWSWAKVNGDDDDGTSYYKISGLQFKNDSIYWTSDSDNEYRQGIFKCQYDELTDTTKFEKIYAIDSHISTGFVFDGDIMIAPVGHQTKDVIISRDGGKTFSRETLQIDEAIDPTYGGYRLTISKNGNDEYALKIHEAGEVLNEAYKGKTLMLKVYE